MNLEAEASEIVFNQKWQILDAGQEFAIFHIHFIFIRVQSRTKQYNFVL